METMRKKVNSLKIDGTAAFSLGFYEGLYEIIHIILGV
jgi:hypothetical protein